MMTSFFSQHWPSKFQSNKFLILLFAITIMLFASVSSAIGAQVTLAWDANNPAPQGYKVYQRIGGTTYDYDHPAWPSDGSDHLQTTCTITNLTAGVTYYFVVRAYLGNDLSGDSNEISYTVPAEVTLSSIAIGGPTQLNENSSAQYTCTAHYSDGSTAALSSGVNWSENASATSINAGGLLTAANVTADTGVTITASYGGRSDTHSVTVRNVAPTLSSIAIGGPTQLNENSSAQYTCTAHYSDNTTSIVTNNVN
ncbi:MAG: fibronectin type III domain-containing protein, partial [Desulfosarcina sp.]